MPIVVYRYGLHAPHDGASLVYEQLQAAHRYRCSLVEIERGRRAAQRAIECEMGNLPAALQALEGAKERTKERFRAIASWRAETRLRKEPEEMRAALNDARTEEKKLSQEARAIRDELRSICMPCRKARLSNPCVHATPRAVALQHAIDAIGERAKELGKNAYENSGAYWGQRALVEEAAGRSFGSLALYDKDWQPNDPGFPRRDLDAAVGLQMIGGLPMTELLGCQDTRVRLRAPDPRAWQGERPNGRATCSARRKYASTAELSLRVGSEGRNPLWARWVCDMDRPLPRDARLQFAMVHKRKIGPYSEWSLCLTLQLPEGPYASEGEQAPTLGGAVAIDTGWRIEGSRIRVCAWRDEHGNSGIEYLPAHVVRWSQSAHELQAERDKRLRGAMLGLMWWAAYGADGAVLPEGLRAAIDTMPKWKSPKHLARVWRTWRENRFAGDERAFGLLTAWHWRDRELWTASANDSLRASRGRRDAYRVFAARLARAYDTIVLESNYLAEVAVREELSEERPNEVARSNRFLVAASVLLESVRGAARSRDRLCVSIAAADTTRTCPNCGIVAERNAAEQIVLACECGHTWDQDVDGACAVLLARWRERPSDAKILEPTRAWKLANKTEEKTEGRRERMMRLRKEKSSRMATAREAHRNGAES
jgi:Putative transposase DNA-binding domain